MRNFASSVVSTPAGGRSRLVPIFIGVAPAWVYSRFLTNLLKHTEQVEAIFNKLIWQLRRELPDLGQSLAIDGKAVESMASRPSKNGASGRRGEHDANWGAKTYTSKGSDGSVRTETKSWFGFKVHTIVDTTYELPVAFEVTKASCAEQPMAIELLDQLEESAPFILDSAEYFTADRGYDSGALHKRLWNVHGIKPVIAIRDLWKAPEGQDATRAVSSLEGVSYNGQGEVFCYSPYGHRHKMAHAGFEKERNALKYRCPARHYGIKCCGQSECKLAGSVRIPIQEDQRIFGPVARDSYKWKAIYAKRTAAERVYSRLDPDGNRGKLPMEVGASRQLRLREPHDQGAEEDEAEGLHGVHDHAGNGSGKSQAEPIRRDAKPRAQGMSLFPA